MAGKEIFSVFNFSIRWDEEDVLCKSALIYSKMFYIVTSVGILDSR